MQTSYTRASSDWVLVQGFPILLVPKKSPGGCGDLDPLGTQDRDCLIRASGAPDG